MNAPEKWNPYAAQCPTRMVLDRIADKWSVLILALLEERSHRFADFLRLAEGLSQKVLSQTLKRLERDGLIRRKAYATVPVTVEYSLTPLGATLAETLIGLVTWSEQNIEAVLAAQQAYDTGKG